MVAPQPFYQDRGTPIAVRQVLEALSELGYAVDLLTFPIGNDIAIPGLHISRAGNPFGIKSVPIGLSFRKILLDFSLITALRGQLRRASYTCIHAVEEAAFPATLIGRRYGVPVLYDMQSSLPEQLAQSRLFSPPPVQRCLQALECWLLRHVHLTVSSTGLAPRVKRLVPEARVREWQFPSAPSALDPAAALELRQRLGIPKGRPIVLYAGTFESYQGLPQLIEAIPLVQAGVPDATFVLVGADPSQKLELRNGSQRLLESGALRIIDRQPRAALPPLLAMADVLVSPRAHGGNLPLKIFDYLAAGRPIVATDIPTHRTVLTGERAILVALSAPALSEGILAALGDPPRAARLGRAARAYASEHLAWPGFVQSVADVYEEVHGHAGAARG